MTGNDVATLYEFSYLALKRNLADLTNQESTFVPETGGDCINWMLGHIVSSRGMLLLLTGESPVFSAEEAAAFQHGPAGARSTESMQLDQLKIALDESQKKLIPALQGLSDDVIAGPVPDKFKRPPFTGSLGEALSTMSYHEGYHNGQIGLLRRMMGKDSAMR